MSRFLKLSNLVINTSKIIYVRKYETVYHIHMDNLDFRGFYFYIFGSISTTDNLITVCQKEKPDDYNIVSKWIEQTPE